MAEPSAGAEDVTAPPETSGGAAASIAMAETTPAEETTVLTMTPTASNKSSPPARRHRTLIIDVSNKLHGFISMCIYRCLASVLSKSPIQLKRKKSQEPGSEGAKNRNGLPYIFLHELCEAHMLPKSGSKQELMDRLVKHYFFNPELVPDSLMNLFPDDEWKKASQKDATLKRLIDQLCVNIEATMTTNVDDEADNHESSLEPLKGTLAFAEFPMPMLACVYHAKKLGLFPKTDTLFFCNHEFSTNLLDEALAGFDTSPWSTQPIGQETQVVQRRTPMCALRLFVLLLVDDKFFERLVNESAATPNRDDLDVSAVGDNSTLWVDVCHAFVNNEYAIPKIPICHRYFVNPGTGELYDISKCLSTWVTPAKLRKWYNTAHNALVMYRTKYDKSGSHDFNSDEGLEEFVTKFAHGNRDCCFLAALANWRGDEALEWFSADLPNNVEIVDGFDLSPPTDTMSEYSKATCSTTTSRGGGDEIDRIVNALATSRGHSAMDSPEKKAYLQQKTKHLKRKSDMELARELRRECNTWNSDDEDEITLKKRMKSASRRIMSGILDDVEAGTGGENGED